LGWKITDFGIAFVTVFGVIPSLIIGIVAFAIFSIAIILAGIVSAIIYTLVAVGIVWLLSWGGVFNNLSKHPLRLLIFSIIPIAFVFGWATDHVKGLAVIAPSQFISSNPSITIQQASLTGDAVTFIMTPMNFAIILALILAPILMLTYKKLKK
jgi:hypothetical protein